MRLLLELRFSACLKLFNFGANFGTCSLLMFHFSCMVISYIKQEEFYEWGSEGTLSLAKNMESNVRLLAVAARDWRMKIQEEKQVC